MPKKRINSDKPQRTVFPVDVGLIERLRTVNDLKKEEQRGMQPNLCFDCYLRHAEDAGGTNRTCLDCKHYEPTCRTYLESVRMLILFER